MNTSPLVFVLVFMLTLAGPALFAQPGALPTEQVEVIKNFDARLLEAEKLSTVPARLGQDTSRVPQQYVLGAKPSALEYEAPRLRPLALKREATPDQFKGFAKAGYGLPNSPYFKGGYHLQRKDQFDLHIGALHHAADNKKRENQRFAETAFDLGGQYHLPDLFTVQAAAGFQQDLASFYGYNPADTSYTSGETKQRFNRIHLGAGLYNTQGNDLGLDYRLETRFYALRDFYDARENGLDARLHLTRWFADSHPLRVVVGNELTSFRDTTGKTLNNFFLQPSFTFHGESFRIRGGINLVTRGEDIHVLPDLEALYSLAGNALAVYAGWRGGHHQNSFDRLRRYNPFIISELTPRTSIYQDVYGGVKGAAQGWHYQAQAGWKRLQDLALFLPDSTDTRRFAVLFDTAQAVYISGGAGAELWPGMTLSGTLTQHFYRLNNQERAWHLPRLEANMSARYTLLSNKMLLRADAYLADGVPYLQEDGEAKRLGGLLDLSFSGHYQLIRNLGVWLQVNNLTNNQRERWQRYPSFGTNILGGLQLRF